MARKTSPIKDSKKLELQYRKSLLVRTQWLDDYSDQIIKELKANKDSFQVDAPATDLVSKINKARAMYLSRFPILQTQRLATAFYKRISSYNSQKLNSAFNALGVDISSALERENLSDFANIAIKNNVDLIKSISDDYFDKIEKLVLNGMQNGKDWEAIGQMIQAATGATHKRAKMIARDQNSTINALLTRKRATNAGFTKAEWVKTKFTKTSNYTPRLSHIKADGKIFDINKGLKVDGEYIFPGQEINCTCFSRILVD